MRKETNTQPTQAERIDWKRGNSQQAVGEYLAWLEIVTLFGDSLIR